jgi:hypothetical protein
MKLNLAASILGAAIVFCAMAYILRFVYDYRVKNNSIEFVLFRALPFYRIPVDNIDSIQKTSWLRLGIGGFTLRFGNRVFGTCVLVHKQRGLFRRIVITPEDADKFVNDVIAAQHGNSESTFR